MKAFEVLERVGRKEKNVVQEKNGPGNPTILHISFITILSPALTALPSWSSRRYATR